VFRNSIEAEEGMEEVVSDLLYALREGGVRVEVFDLIALSRIAWPIAAVMVDGERLPVVEPRGTWATAESFDRAMFAAGMDQYIRAQLPGDVIPPDAAPGMVWVDHRMRGG
jgi:hypothetical protein